VSPRLPDPRQARGGLIVVAGEALVDLVQDASGRLVAHPGGGPFNAARAAGRLRQPVAFLGPVAGDRFGRQLRERLARDSVRLDAVVDSERPTTLALAQLDARGRVEYRFYAEGTSVPDLSVEAARRALPAGVALLHVGGLGLVFEPIAAALEALVRAAARRAIVTLDPNCRPAAVADATAYRRRLGRVLRHAAVVKASEEDLAWLDPARPPAETARSLLDQGPALVLLTLGARGATVLTAAGERAVPSPPVAVRDTIGAGDAFCGAFLAWWRSQGLGRAALSRPDTAVEAARFACLVAARTCERAGASPPRLSELEA